MPLPWMKMWLEALDDPKLTRLSLAERGAWWGLLQLAGKSDAGGKIVSGGQGLNLDEIADALHIKSSEERQALESMITKMEKRGSLVWNDNVLTVVHWEERQRVPPSSRPEAVAERVRAYRERKQKAISSSIIRGGTVPEAESFALQTWQEVLQELKKQVNASNFRTWLAGTTGLSWQNGIFTIGVPNIHIAAYLSRNQESLIEKVLKEILKKEVRVNFYIAVEGERSP